MSPFPLKLIVRLLWLLLIYAYIYIDLCTNIYKYNLLSLFCFCYCLCVYGFRDNCFVLTTIYETRPWRGSSYLSHQSSASHSSCSKGVTPWETPASTLALLSLLHANISMTGCLIADFLALRICLPSLPWWSLFCKCRSCGVDVPVGARLPMMP